MHVATFTPRAASGCATVAVVLGLTMASLAQASVMGASTDVFQPGRSEINFGGLSPGTINPVYEASANQSNGPRVSFGSYFGGQSPGTIESCGTAGCLEGSPRPDLTLVQSETAPTFVTTAQGAPNNPVLSGWPVFTGAISILFSQDQSGVGVSVGSALAPGAERLTAFDRNGDTLASIVNDATGFSFLTLASDDARVAIAGVQITRTGATNGGYALDRVLFGGPDQVKATNTTTPTDVPSPGNLSLFALGLIAMVGFGLGGRARSRV